MLTCREMTELITDYLEKRLPLRKRLLFRMHIGMCRHCRAYLRQMKLTVRALGKLPELTIPDDVKAELLWRFQAWKK